MWGRDEKDLVSTLASMQREARIRSNGDRTAAKQVFLESVVSDRRYDQWDPRALVDRADAASDACATFELNKVPARRR